MSLSNDAFCAAVSRQIQRSMLTSTQRLLCVSAASRSKFGASALGSASLMTWIGATARSAESAVGRNAARIAAGMGARVLVLNRSVDALMELEASYRASLLSSRLLLRSRAP